LANFRFKRDQKIRVQLVRKGPGYVGREVGWETTKLKVVMAKKIRED